MTATASVPSSASSTWAVEGRPPRIAIIGAGMSGIAAVVKQRRHRSSASPTHAPEPPSWPPGEAERDR